MENRIIGYRVPYDVASKPKINKGEIFTSYGTYLKHQGSGITLMIDFCRDWEPVYETIIETKNTEMFINLKSTGMTVMPLVASHVIHKNEKEAREEAKEIINHAGTFKLIKI